MKAPAPEGVFVIRPTEHPSPKRAAKSTGNEGSRFQAQVKPAIKI